MQRYTALRSRRRLRANEGLVIQVLGFGGVWTTLILRSSGKSRMVSPYKAGFLSMVTPVIISLNVGSYIHSGCTAGGKPAAVSKHI